ncbi:UPF0489 family protein [Cystobacter fuscus]|uniref:UPF0489 family protein n=1 Tax=Cystobacter fuscus TaxID=43 RepID=UPI000BB3C3F2|nr:UPF0489 family protein [Cystobacter fuscus]
MMHEVDFSQLQPDDEYLSDLGADVWLMGDHRWAFLVWTRFGLERGIERFSLIHADHHWDGINDFYEREEARDRLLAADLTKIEAMVRNKELIQFDSFIAPAVIRKLVTEVHFFGSSVRRVGRTVDKRPCAWGGHGAQGRAEPSDGHGIQVPARVRGMNETGARPGVPKAAAVHDRAPGSAALLAGLQSNLSALRGSVPSRLLLRRGAMPLLATAE